MGVISSQIFRVSQSMCGHTVLIRPEVCHMSQGKKKSSAQIALNQNKISEQKNSTNFENQ